MKNPIRAARFVFGLGLPTASLSLFFFACTTAPQPDPIPTPEHYVRQIQFPRDGIGQLIIRATPPVVTAERIRLSGADNVSAWLTPRMVVAQDSLVAFEVWGQPTIDFCIGFGNAAERDTNASNGMYGAANRTRLYYFDNKFVMRNVRKAGIIREDTLFRASNQSRVQLGFGFARDSVSYYFQGRRVGGDALGPNYQGDIAFEVAAYNTPRYGVAWIDSLRLRFHSLPPETLRVEWNPNTEPDLAGYFVRAYTGNAVMRSGLLKTNFYRFISFALVHDFEVYAVDFSGNVSQPSARVRYQRTQP